MNLCNKCARCGEESTDPTGWKYLKTPAPSWRCPSCWARIRKATAVLYEAALDVVLNHPHLPWKKSAALDHLMDALLYADGQEARP